MNKKLIKYFFISYIVLFAVCDALAASLAVSPTGSGNGSGSDWNNTISWSSITFVRGNTYYLMGGTYNSKQYSTSNNGTSTITIKKATVSDYGGLANWQSSYGDGQAIIGSITLISNYWVFDGATRNENDWTSGSSYGFKVTDVSTHSLNFGNASDNITIRYCDIGGTYSFNYSSGIPDYGIYFGGFGQTCDNWTISRNFIHNVGLVGQMAGVDNIIWEYNWLGLNWSKEIVRGQIRATNVTFRYNILKDGCRNDGSGGEGCTAEIGIFGNQGDTPNFNGFAAYGNIIWKTISQFDCCGSIMVESTSGGVIYNNTIVSAGSGSANLRLFWAPGSIIRNNVFYLTGGMSAGCEAATCDNNSVYSSSPPFINVSGGNFRLTSALAGVSLSSTYNTDMDGNTRGDDGVWDRGAYEYDSGTTPAAPTKVRIISIF